MAHQRFSKWSPGSPIEIDLSSESIREAIGEIGAYGEDLLEKVDEFTRRMAEEGVEFSKVRLIEYGASDTGHLVSSMDMRRGDAVKDGSSWIVFTDNYYAQYVEFGTGPVGNASPHPSGQGRYRTTGWTYYNARSSRFVHTTGMPARPFMWDTYNHLKDGDTIKRIAKEVFG